MRAMMAKALVILILAGAAVPATLAAQEPLEATGLEREVRQLNVTLGRIVELMQRQLESSNAAVLMQRVQLMTNRIAPLEEELRAARGVVRDQQRQLDDADLSDSSFRGNLEIQIEIDEIDEEEARVLQYEHDRMSVENRKQIEGRLWTAQQRVIDLEQAIAARRAELETWEGEIDRVLGLR